jgi:hypothetical protein
MSSGIEKTLHTPLRMDEIYQLHPTEHYLIPIDLDALSSSAYRLLNRINNGSVICSPRLETLLSGPQPQSQESLTTTLLGRELKDFPLHALSTRAIITTLSQEEATEEEISQAPHWKRLWRERLEHRSRTILWRNYHNKLSNGSRMHKMVAGLPENCHTCGVVETQEHMLLACDSKREVWEACLTEFTTTQTWTPNNIAALLHLKKQHITIKPPYHCTPLQLIATSLLSIWDHHWRTKLDNTIFSRTVGTAAALCRLRNFNKQLAYAHNPPSISTSDMA